MTISNIITEYEWDNSLPDFAVWNMILNENIHLIDIIDKSGDQVKTDSLNLIKCIKYVKDSSF